MENLVKNLIDKWEANGIHYEYIKDFSMKEERKVKSINMGKSLAKIIEKMARAENRSFSRQVIVMLNDVLQRQGNAPAQAGQ